MDQLLIFGILFVFVGVLLILMGLASNKNVEVHGGAVGFIGPIPIGVGTSPWILVLLLILTIILSLTFWLR